MAELRELSDADLRARENELDEEIFRVRMNQGKEQQQDLEFPLNSPIR